MTAKRRAAYRWAAAVGLLLTTTGARWMFGATQRHEVPGELRTVMLQDRKALPGVALIDQHGRAVTADALFGKRWSLVFLGFASCPGVCPATLAQLATVKRALGRLSPDTPQPRYVFVSVDPRRDTPQRLSSYLAAFDPDFIGATGEPAQLARLSDALTAFHRVGAPDPSGDYGVVHSGEIYLIDPAGRPYARFTPPLDTGAIPRQLIALMGWYAADSVRPGGPS
jgi:protein SCO1/2